MIAINHVKATKSVSNSEGRIYDIFIGIRWNSNQAPQTDYTWFNHDRIWVIVTRSNGLCAQQAWRRSQRALEICGWSECLGRSPWWMRLSRCVSPGSRGVMGTCIYGRHVDRPSKSCKSKIPKLKRSLCFVGFGGRMFVIGINSGAECLTFLSTNVVKPSTSGITDTPKSAIFA